MKINDIFESTTAGSVATVAMPLGGTQKREGSLFKGKKTKKKFYEAEVSEAEVNEADLILVPGHGNKVKPGFIPKDKDRTDHEVEMARSDLFHAAQNAKEVYKMIQQVSEDEGLEGWVQEKIIKANDYLNTVREYLEHKTYMQEGGVIAGGMSNFEEGETPKTGVKWFDFATWMLKQGDKYKKATTDRTVYKAAQKAYKDYLGSQKEGVAEGLDAEEYKQKLLSSLPQMIRFYEKNVKGWKPSEEQMLAAVETGYTVMKHTGDVKQAGKAVMDELNTLHRMSQGQGVAEEQAPMFTPEEEQLDEKKDACYNKVKSRYKVWPSAYASGALVKCRKVGASNWGNSSKK